MYALSFRHSGQSGGIGLMLWSRLCVIDIEPRTMRTTLSTVWPATGTRSRSEVLRECLIITSQRLKPRRLSVSALNFMSEKPALLQFDDIPSYVPA
ncbi:MAG: hypothetical protein JWN85_3596 [Gammaproteobacteria bacterium]|nr:hypothetical protein [Gammaproteobacteria bacterium]